MRVRLLLLFAGLLGLSGCAAFGSCLFRCGTDRQASTPLVDFLYPSGKVPDVAPGPVELTLPLRVGLTFVPGGSEPFADAMQREQILSQVRERFRTLNYVSDISIVPDIYLRPRGGFDSLEQLARLHRFDVIALVSADQISHRDERQSSFWYLTVVGAFVVRGSEQATHTLLDLAVVDPVSRSLVLRTGGTSSISGSSTAVEQNRKVREQRADGIQLATGQLIANLDTELKLFAERVRAGNATVQVRRKSGGGGAVGGAEVALAMLLAAWVSGRRYAARKPSMIG